MTSQLGDVVTTTGTKELPDFDIENGIRTIAGKSNYRTEFKISKSGERVEKIYESA